MGIPIDYHILFCALSIMFFVLIIMLLFNEPAFDKVTAAFILCFLNVVFSAVAGQGFFAFDLYGYDTSGEIVDNLISEYSALGMIFVVIAYICIIFLFYCIYLWYKKPWENVRKIEGNPYVNYK